MRVSREEFEELVREAVEALPPRLEQYMENVVIVVEDEPSRNLLKENNVPAGKTLFGHYRGVPRSERGKRGNYGFVPPDKITIFQQPIQLNARNREELKNIVSETVWHEIAHHFGMDEERVRRMERERDS